PRLLSPSVSGLSAPLQISLSSWYDPPLTFLPDHTRFKYGLFFGGKVKNVKNNPRMDAIFPIQPK
ncbi:MAG TPA: hypothetical protein VIS94_12240, partial [Desulfomonilia bacterium]